MTDRADGGGALALDAVLSDLDDALDRLSALPLWQLPDPALKTAAAALDRARRRTDGQTIRLLGEVDSRGIPSTDGTKTAGNWLLSVVPDQKPGAAGALGKRAEKLYRSTLSPELAPTRAAAEAGSLRAHQERLVVETVEQLTPPNLPADHPDAVPAEVIQQAQELLLEYAPALSPRDFDRLVTELRPTLDPRADDRLAKDEKLQARKRSFVMVTDASGMTFVEGLLTKECGAALKTALDAWSAPAPADDGTLDPRSPGQRSHDALQMLAETALSTDKVPTSHGSPTRVIVRVTAETLNAAAAGRAGAPGRAASAATAETLPAGRGVPGSRRGASPGEQSAEGARRPATQASHEWVQTPPAELENGTPISSQLLAKFMCQAELIPVLVDGLGNPLDVGRTLRLHTTKQRIALAERDRGCTWEHCTAPASWCEAHHLTPWQAGGHTTVHDGALLCGRHHRHVHATGATGRAIDGRVVWDTGPPDERRPEPPPTPHLIAHLVRQWLTLRRR
ncbi:MAG: DUF222 domain-containing protein [Angustibacter sp.]